MNCTYCDKPVGVCSCADADRTVVVERAAGPKVGT